MIAVCSFLASPDLARLSRRCSAARDELRRRRALHPELHGAAVCLARHFGPRRRAVLERSGLRRAARAFIDGDISGLTVQGILALERLYYGRCDQEVQRDMQAWRLTEYTDERGWVRRLTVSSVVHHLLMGPEDLKTVWGGSHGHCLQLYVQHPQGGIILPSNIRLADKGQKNSFYSWGFYCRMTDSWDDPAPLKPLESECS